MKFIRLISCLSVVFLFSLNASAQKNFSKEANDAYKHEAYNLAIDLYKKAYSKVTKAAEKARITFMIGECYRFNTEVEQAEIFYKKAIMAKYDENDPIVYYDLALVQKQQGRYADALENYNKYKEKKPGDPRGIEGAKTCELAKEWTDNPSRYIVNAEILLNTPNFDFSPTFADKKNKQLVFCSSRDAAVGSKIDDRTGENFQSLFSATRDKTGKWSEPSLLNEMINTEANEGTACFDKKYGTMYFTRCPNVKKQNLGCEIWVSSKQGNNWAEPTLVPLKPEGADTISVGHPCLTNDNLRLIFASDLPGGEGGKDLWMVEYNKKDKTWGTPVNLGSNINTPGDEMFPYIRENGDLYYSSNGLPGMGGLDIFHATLVQGENYSWENPENMKFPINSEAHDFGIIFDKGDQDKGFLTSNRNGGKGRDDIYSFHLPPIIFALECYVYDKDSHEAVKNAKINLVGTDNSSYEVTTDDNGVFDFEKINDKDRYIKKEATYNIVVSAENYLVGKDAVTTVGLTTSTKFAKEFYIQYTDPKKEITFPEVQYDLDKWLLREESKDSLDFLYQTIVDNPTIIIELAAHTDSRGSNSYNKKLSEKRAKSCVDYLVSKGIPSERMIPHGYGEERLKISDAEIKKLKTKEEQEAAHQMNRRTVFSVLSYDYVPTANNDTNDEGVNPGN